MRNRYHLGVRTPNPTCNVEGQENSDQILVLFRFSLYSVALIHNITIKTRNRKPARCPLCPFSQCLEIMVVTLPYPSPSLIHSHHDLTHGIYYPPSSSQPQPILEISKCNSQPPPPPYHHYPKYHQPSPFNDEPNHLIGHRPIAQVTGEPFCPNNATPATALITTACARTGVAIEIIPDISGAKQSDYQPVRIPRWRGGTCRYRCQCQGRAKCC